MANYDFLKSKKLPLGVFAGVRRAPSPARIFITLKYNENFEFLRGTRGFKFTPENETSTIVFEIPVMPPTIKVDFGNTKDNENVTRIGEVVLPKYQKAKQFRWESFFPYDTRANYLSTTVRNLSWGSLSDYKDKAVNFYQDAVNSINGSYAEPTPEKYIKLFELLTQTEEPFIISMTFYEGGNIPATKVTLDTFGAEPENNGDYKYEISLVKWTKIGPKLLNNKGEVIEEESSKVQDSTKSKIIQKLSDFWKFTKKCYGVVSKPLIWAFATYNGVRGLVFDAILKAWKIKGILQDLGGRFGILNNIFGLSKITSKDTKYVSDSLKKLSFTKASKQMAEFLNQNKMYRS